MSLFLGCIKNKCLRMKNEKIEANRGIFEGLINSTINKIINNLTDPLVLDDISINSTEDAMNGSLNVTKPTITGIKKIVASKIELKLLSMSLNMTISIPELTANFKYAADMLLASLIPVYGNGLINVNFDDIELTISGKASINGTKIQIKNTVVYLYIKNAVFNLNGLLNNPEFSALLSAILNDNLCKFIDTYASVISDLISPILETLLNKMLGRSSISEDFIEEYQILRQQYQLDWPKIY